MNTTEKKELMGKFGVKLEKAIKRETAIKKELENDKALLKYLQSQKTSGVAFENEVYENYDSWIATVEKQIKKGDSSLNNLEFKKVELEAVKVYSSQNS